MKYKEFESELGNVAVTRDHIEREEVTEESKHWERITENFHDKELVDYIHLSEIEDIEYRDESVYPCIRIKTEDGWKKLFFHVGDNAEECFRILRYNWHAYKQTA